ncbi:YciK family oxidoreductase [Simiduia agarivorans]|uniref:Oxidoreductase n=1 Tax=Simiduia agarivorans (strain DSM 21679 / JCM 13881 / BCRC 17597 / SA1) TaxID=1117647 RepID=K4KID5_SIMAS|nr:YciK family oxidoreductase [Simiduia agarivorans]AFU97718.1 oxidoreductase [Simiduia agarivorans SA1 = DSM 21679]
MKLSEYAPAKDLLKDKIIIVTGAGSGIGKQAALTFARHGATVVLMGRTIAKLEQVYDAIDAENLPQAAIYPINFEGAVEKDYIDMADKIDDAFGRIDGILFNAAELGERTPLENYAADTWQKILQVNATAPFLMVKSLLPLLRAAPSASVVFTGSSVGYRGRAYWGAYAASKAAQENLMQTLADEEDGTSQVRANSINPAATRTAMRAAAYPAENPEDVKPADALMPAYLWLLGPDSAVHSGKQFDWDSEI